MNKIRKCLAALSAFILVFTSGANNYVHASNTDVKSDDSMVQQVTINEYEAVKLLAEKPITQLAEEGFSSDEISKIKNYKQAFNDHIMMLQKLSDEVLDEHGYNQSQINTIKNFTGSDEQRMIASASLAIYGSISAYSYPSTSGRTTATLGFSWSWSGIPVVRLTDLVAISWNSWEVTSKAAYVPYYGIDTGTYYTSGSPTFTNSTNSVWNGGGYKVNMNYADYYYAKSGMGHFNLISDVVCQKYLYYYMEHGHNILNLTPSFSVSIPGGASGSISLSTGLTCVGSCSGVYPQS